MATQWAKKEAKTNELAVAVESAASWAGKNRAVAIGAAIATVALTLGGVALYQKIHAAREAGWTTVAIAQSMAYSGQQAQALAQLQELSNKESSSLAAGHGELLAADLLYQQEKYAEAASAYRKVIESRPDKMLTPLALAGLGISQESAGDYKTAAETAQRFLDSHSDSALCASVHASLARSLIALGKTEEAGRALSRIAVLYPDTYWAAWAKERSSVSK